MKAKPTSNSPIPRTSAGLRNVLFDTLDDLRAGKTSARNAAAVASVVNQIVVVTKLELVYQRFVQTSVTDSPKPILPSLQMGE